MSATNGHHDASPDYWLAYLAAAIGGALVSDSLELARATLKDALQRFTRSQHCDAHLRDEIAKIGKGKG